MLTTINNEIRKSITFSAPVNPNVNKPRINIQPPLNVEKRVLPPPKKRIRPIPVTSPCDLSSSPFSSPAHLSMLEFPLKPKEIPTVPTNSSSGRLKEVKDLPLPPFILEENRCKNERINSKYILDSESTISISGDPKFLSDSEPNVSIEIQNSMFLPDIESGISDVMIDSKLISHPEKDASKKKADDSKLVPNSESNEIVDDSNILPEPNISDRVIFDSKLAPNDKSNTPRKAMKDSKLLTDSETDEDSIIDSHPLSNSTAIMSPPHVQIGRRHLSGKPQSMMAFYKNAFPNKEIPISPDTIRGQKCKNYSNKEESSLVEVSKEKKVIQIENLYLRDESNKKCSLNNGNNLLSEDTSEKKEISKELPTVSMKNSLNEDILINSHPNPESSLFDRVSTKKKTPTKAKLPSSFTKEDSDELIKSPLNQKKNLLFEVSSEKTNNCKSKFSV
ncbi:hypothetical protein CEXT_454641 [Caerostris extrusa]|uniref:Uncharacterized protein n=1 Tax=Caerostris extrusa TaxID=172846 RepID=A0AAV4N9M2_CAEEX|nr:hypothetical protein CEXT_454641 [Caerostris extrusa]